MKQMTIRQQFRNAYIRHMCEVMELKRNGECDGSLRPGCYQQCPHGVYCGEWQHTTHPFSVLRR